MRNNNVAKLISGTGFFIMGFIFRDFVGPQAPPPAPPFVRPIPQVCPAPETCPVLAICPTPKKCKWDAFFEENLSCAERADKYGCPWHKQGETMVIHGLATYL